MVEYVSDDRFVVEIGAFDALVKYYSLEAAIEYLQGELWEEGLVLSDSQRDALVARYQFV